MTRRSLVVGCLAIAMYVGALYGQTSRPQSAPPASQPRQAQPAAPAPQTARPQPVASVTTAPAIPVEDQRAFLTRSCVGCHSEKMKAAGLDSSRRLTMDALDPANVDKDREKWELVVRKTRAGQMPPLGVKRPDPDRFDAVIASFESSLDRTAPAFTPPPGLHRLNRTEYANVVRDLLDLQIDPGKYLPSDDSTSGFDNIAGALGLSSTLVEAYVSAAQKISRLAMGYAEEPTLVVYRTREDTSQDYHVEGMPFGTRGGMLVSHVFPSDGEYTLTVTPIFGDNMSPTGFGSVPCERLSMLLDGEELSLINWQGGGRNQPTNCGNRGRGAGPAGPIGGGGQSGPEAFFGGRGGTPMRIRFKTTAGGHTIGATFLATNFAPLLDLDKHFMRSTVQTGPTPGLHILPARRDHAHRGPVQRHGGEGFSEPPQDLHVHAEGGSRGNRVRAAHRQQPRDVCVPQAGNAGRRRSPDGVLPVRP